MRNKYSRLYHFYGSNSPLKMNKGSTEGDVRAYTIQGAARKLKGRYKYFVIFKTLPGRKIRIQYAKWGRLPE